MSGKRRDGGGTIEIRGRKVVAKMKHPITGQRVRVPLSDIPLHLTDPAEQKLYGQKKLDGLLESGKRTGKLAELIDRLLGASQAKAEAKAAAGMTVRQLGERWTSGELFKKYGNVAGLAPTASDQINSWALRKHCYGVRTRSSPAEPLFGGLLVKDVTVADITAVMGAQTGASGTRLHTYQRLKRLFDLAEMPCELRPARSNPVLPGHRPVKDEVKGFAWLYPTELMALLGCRQIPVGRRVLYLLATYFGWRKGTLYAFKWSGIDWQHEMIRVLHQKGRKRLGQLDNNQGTPIYFAVDYAPAGEPRDTRGVLSVLRRWQEYSGHPSAETPVVRLTGTERGHDEAVVLRDDLRLAGINRELLFLDGSNVEPLRFHDLRASFCTWARRQNRTDAWISDRTGHKPTHNTIDRYTRQAMTLSDLRIEPFLDVTNAIPELAPGAAMAAAAPVVPMARPWWDRRQRAKTSVGVVPGLSQALSQGGRKGEDRGDDGQETAEESVRS